LIEQVGQAVPPPFRPASRQATKSGRAGYLKYGLTPGADAAIANCASGSMLTASSSSIRQAYRRLIEATCELFHSIG
jgi:hypothetical protein